MKTQETINQNNSSPSAGEKYLALHGIFAQNTQFSYQEVVKLLNGFADPSPPLKALSEITDEHLLDIGKSMWNMPDQLLIRHSKEFMRYHFNVKHKEDNGLITARVNNIEVKEFMRVYQFLQHKGYAVPVFYPVPEVKEKGENDA